MRFAEITEVPDNACVSWRLYVDLETHQICFCTIASLQALQYIDKDSIICLEQISENILNKIVQDRNIDINLASEIFFSSKIFIDIANKKSEYKEKDWQDIYNKLQEEIGNN